MFDLILKYLRVCVTIYKRKILDRTCENNHKVNLYLLSNSFFNFFMEMNSQKQTISHFLIFRNGSIKKLKVKICKT